MKERPILFNAPMVRAILDGTKTQTRRVVKGGPLQWLVGAKFDPAFVADPGNYLCPYGQPGDRLWVRENFCPIYPQDPTYNGGRPIEYDYAATYQHGNRLGDTLGIKKRWKPSIHMPRWASRITLEITGVRVERLQDISEADAIAEGVGLNAGAIGVPTTGESPQPMAIALYQDLWQSINGPDSWTANPWVWAVEFKRIDEIGETKWTEF